MTRHLDEGLGTLLAAWVRVVQRRARFVVVLALAGTFAIIPYTAAHLRIDADATHMFAPTLPFQRLLADYDRAFPKLDDRLYVVIDAATPGRAQEAADALAGRLAREAGVFQSIYRPGAGPFFDTHALLYLEPRELEDLADRLADVQPYLAELAADESLRGNVAVLGEALDAVRTGKAIGFDLVVVLDRVRAAVDAALEGRPYEAPWRDVLFGHAAWASKRRQFLDLKPRLDFGALAPGKEAIAAVHRLARELRLDPAHGVRVRVTGSVALAYEEMESARRGATIAALLSLALVTLILFVALRSLRLVVATVVTLGLGLIWTAGFAAVAIGHLNLFSVAFAVLFIGLGVDFGIHMCVHYRELTGRGHTAADALAESVRTVGSSLTLCAATTATGFYAFWPTGFSGVAELGVICGTGMVISLVANLTVLPAMLQLMPPAPGTARHPRDHRLAAWLALPIRHRRAVRAGAIALGLGALALLPAVRFDYNPVRLRDPRTESVATFNDLLKDGTSPWTVDILMPDQQAAAALARRLETLNTVDRAVTLTDYVPQAQDAKRAIIEDIALFMPPPTTQRHKAPTTEQQVTALRAFRARLDALLAAGVEPALAASAQRLRAALERFLIRVRRTGEAAPLVATLEQSLLGSLPRQLRLLRAALHPGRVTVADLPADLRQRMVAPDGRVRVQVFARHNLADNAALARFVDSVRGVTPKATGSAVNVVAAARVVVRAVRSALLIALALIGTLLWVLWRRLDDTVVVLIPLVLAGASTAAASVVLGIPFNFANVIVLPFLLGFGVDSGIHLVHRQRTGLRAGENLLETSTARAVFFSALTTIASFGSLGLSPHRGMASLGQMLTIGVCLTLVCTLVVLPALGRSASAKPAGRAMETNHEDTTERDKMSSVA